MAESLKVNPRTPITISGKGFPLLACMLITKLTFVHQHMLYTKAFTVCRLH